MENTAPKDALYKLLGLVALIALLFVFFRVFDISAVQARVEEAGVWGPLILILAKASTIILVPLSGSPIYPIAGALFGFWKGLLYLIAGDILGGVVAFYISRIFGRSIAERFFGRDGNLVNKALDMMGSIRGFLLARLAFITFPEIPAYAAGLSRIRFIYFLPIYAAVGAIPTSVMVGLGAFLTDENNSLIFGGVLFLGAIVSGISIWLFIQLLGGDVDKSGESR